jgi:3-hydroxyisobutyrate dehydrogenase-like beta-hydroxyacid dehydrogenase
MVNQICIADLVEALAEGLNWAGLDGDQVLDVISKGAAQSREMENRGKTILRGEFDFYFAVDWMRKDLGIFYRGRPQWRAAADHGGGRPNLQAGTAKGWQPV